MFMKDVFGNMERLSIYVAKPTGELLGCLDDDIDESSASLSLGINQQYELSFTIKKSADNSQSWYEYLQEGMYLFIPGIGLFKMNAPSTSLDDFSDSKEITAYSCDCELSDKDISLSFNMGTETSMEYLVEYDDDEDEYLLNPYTGIPYDWLVLYNTFPEQLEIVKEKYNQSYFGTPDSSGEIVVTDENLIQELQTLFTLIPRLKSKVVSYVTDILDSGTLTDETGDGSVSDYIDVSNYDTVRIDYSNMYYTGESSTTGGAYISTFDSSHSTVGDVTILEYGENLTLDIDVSEATYIRIHSTLRKVNYAVTVKDYNTTEDDAVDYELIEYIIYEYGDGEDEVVSITLTSSFPERIDSLITFYTKYREQLSLLCLVLDKTDGNWTVGDIYGVSDGDYSFANKKYQFEADENIYSFLTNTLAQTVECIITFDIVNRKVNVMPAEAIGKDTGILLSYDNLLNSVKISCDEDNLCTRIYVTGSDDLDIDQVNFGLSYIDDIDYKLNAVDANGNRLYVSDELAEKYKEYTEYKESLRDEYVQCSKDYNSYDSEIYELMYRVPNDVVKTEWNTFSLEELEAALTSYKNLLVTLESLYKNDYGTAGLNTDGSINETYMKTTIYWYDYCAYQTAITQIECAISVFPYYDDQDNWTTSEIAQYKEAISAWETQWELYGTVELQSKISTYKQNMELLEENGSVIVADSDTYITKTLDSGTLTGVAYSDYIDVSDYDSVTLDWETTMSALYLTYDEDKTQLSVVNLSSSSAGSGTAEIDTSEVAYLRAFTPNGEMAYTFTTKINGVAGEAIPWDDLTDSQKADYGSLSLNYYYDTYMEYYNYMVEAQEYLDSLQEDIDSLRALQETSQTRRLEIVDAVTMTNYFTEDECKILNRLFKESTYTNENILTTSLNNTVDSLDVMLELLEDGKEQASILSRPQLSFSVNADNFLGLSDYEAFWSDFNLGNYMTVQYRDGTYAKLRMVGYTFNPCLPSDKTLTLTFSNYIRSKSGLSDIESMLGLATSSGSSSGGSSGSGSGGTYGESDDIDVTISNTMLAKLLNTELFGTRVTNVILDTIDANAITARYATFNGLANGTTTIDGKCITTGYIISNDYDGSDGSISNTQGSILNLETGQFNLGGGSITWDGSTLDVDGIITANAGSKIGAFSIYDNYITNSNIESATNTSVSGVYMGTDGFNVSGGTSATTAYFTKGTVNIGGKLTWNGTTGVLSITGKITTESTPYKTVLESGKVQLYYNDTLYGNFSSTAWASNNEYRGIGLYAKNSTSYISFGIDSDGDSTYESSYIINYGLNPDDYSETHLLYGETRIIGSTTIGSNLTVTGGLYLNNDIYYLGYLTDGGVYCNGKFSTVGSVMVGNNNFGYKLNVDGSTYIKGDLYMNDGAIQNQWALENRASSSEANVRITTDGTTGVYRRVGSSSARYKHDIENIKSEELEPNKLLKLPVRQYIYNDDYLVDSDSRYGECVPGFIAEEVHDIYPIAVDYAEDGVIEDWNYRYILPPMLKLIQDSYSRIDELTEEISCLKSELELLKENQ